MTLTITASVSQLFVVWFPSVSCIKLVVENDALKSASCEIYQNWKKVSMSGKYRYKRKIMISWRKLKILQEIGSVFN